MTPAPPTAVSEPDDNGEHEDDRAEREPCSGEPSAGKDSTQRDPAPFPSQARLAWQESFARQVGSLDLNTWSSAFASKELASSLRPALNFVNRDISLPGVTAGLTDLPWKQSIVAWMTGPQLQSIMDPFRSFVSGWIDSLQLPDFGEILRALDAQTIPDNLRELGITGRNIDGLSGVLHDGIPLFWLPRARISRRLIAAETSAARRQIIGNERAALIEDCKGVLDLITNTDYLYEADRLREVGELIPSHHTAAQALATTTLDSLLYRISWQKQQVYDVITSNKKRHKSGHEETARARLQGDLGRRGSLALAPVRTLYEQFEPKSPGRVPTQLNKHASFHRVHPFQYHKRNATIALMLGTSVLFYMSRWFDTELEQAGRRAERDANRDPERS